MKIGFIGLGIMGSRMAANLQKNDYPLVVFNRTRAKAEPLLGPCGTFSDSPAKLAEQVDVLFTMLAHPDAVEQAALGANGFLDHLKPNSLWVDCSSVNPSFSKKMAAEAARAPGSFCRCACDRLRCSCRGSEADFLGGGRSGRLGNDSSASAVYGQQNCSYWRTWNRGLHENGSQSVTGQCHGRIRRRHGFGRRTRNLAQSFVRFIARHACGRTVSKSKREKIESGNYEAEFPLRWMQKDMHLASVSAYESGVAMPVTNAAKELYRLAMSEGHATEDFSAIYDYLTTIHQKLPAPGEGTPPLIQ